MMTCKIMDLMCKILLFQKKLSPSDWKSKTSVFRIGSIYAIKNKWVEGGKQVSRKVSLCSLYMFAYAVICLLVLAVFVCIYLVFIISSEPFCCRFNMLKIK